MKGGCGHGSDFLIMIIFKSARGPECYCSCSFEKCGKRAWRVEVDDNDNVQSCVDVDASVLVHIKSGRGGRGG